MKKIALAGATLALALALTAGSALAANSLNSGTFGINVPLQNTPDNFMINGKYVVSNGLAVLGGAGLRIAGGDVKGTDIGFLVGVRKYLKTDDFAPFVGGRFQYTSTNDSNTTNLGLLAEAGAEYFLAKQFSLEGSVGFGYTSTETKTIGTVMIGPIAVPTSTTTKATYIGTGTVSVSANFYF